MIAEAFKRSGSRGEAALVPYITGGFPSLDATLEQLDCLECNGADVIEIGIPFADPVADGPTIQRSSHQALLAGATLRKILQRLTTAPAAVPRVVMSYLNPLMALSSEELVAGLREASVSGLIVPDLPMEESESWGAPLAGAGIDLILLAAPTSDTERLRQIGKRSRGFLYYVTVTGITGARGNLPTELREQIRRAKSVTDIPVAAGFGISTPEQVEELSGVADGIVVGSRIVQAIEKREDLAILIRDLKSATRSDNHVGGHEVGSKQ